jgi:metallo-beta-lactamase family protein
MRVRFHGATRTVTGSLHVVETGDTRLYLDCGLYQGRRRDAFEWNRRLPTPARDVDAVILSHAHLDHCGNLPTLVAQGFRGPIYCTPATRDLATLVLRDSAKVQREDVRTVNRRRRRAGEEPVEALYDAHTVDLTVARFQTVSYGQQFRAGKITATLHDAGHILGSAFIVLEAGGRRLGFSGDVGRPRSPIVHDPRAMPAVDMLLVESTYGDRTHKSLENASVDLAEIVRTTTARGGRVLIPAFAIGRTQEVLYVLNQQRAAGEIPGHPVYVDSPMATDATKIFRRHKELFDDDMRRELRRRDPFGFKGLRYLRSVSDSRAVIDSDHPCIVVATSGMVEGGRILSHLERYLGDDRSTLLFVGFQAEHTLGRRLRDGAKQVRIYGDPYNVSIQVAEAESFSAHGDRTEILAWVKRIPSVGRAFCVHGDEGPATTQAAAMNAAGVATSVPTVGQVEEV